jgi:hypothetical protein
MLHLFVSVFIHTHSFLFRRNFGYASLHLDDMPSWRYVLHYKSSYEWNFIMRIFTGWGLSAITSISSRSVPQNPVSVWGQTIILPIYLHTVPWNLNAKLIWISTLHLITLYILHDGPFLHIAATEGHWNHSHWICMLWTLEVPEHLHLY